MAILRVVEIQKLYKETWLKQLGSFILSELFCNMYFWISNEINIEQKLFIDSQIPLEWTNTVNKQFKAFVQNRVTAVIQNVVGKFFELNDDLPYKY